jgi:hypothetical protein
LGTFWIGIIPIVPAVVAASFVAVVIVIAIVVIVAAITITAIIGSSIFIFMAFAAISVAAIIVVIIVGVVVEDVLLRIARKIGVHPWVRLVLNLLSGLHLRIVVRGISSIGRQMAHNERWVRSEAKEEQ